MTKEKAKHLAEVLNAYAEGKPIEVFLDGEWSEITSDGLFNFDVENDYYRIKKEPTCRPFKNAKECFEEMKKHQPFGWLKAKDLEQYYSITIVHYVENYNRYYNLFSNCTFADGQPFGIKE